MVSNVLNGCVVVLLWLLHSVFVCELIDLFSMCWKNDDGALRIGDENVVFNLDICKLG